MTFTTMLLYLATAVFAFLSIGNFLAFVHSRHIGTLLASVASAYGVWGALTGGRWTAIAIAFALLVGLRLLGLDPGDPARTGR